MSVEEFSIHLIDARQTQRRDLPEERPEDDGEYRCPECGNQATRSSSGVEYGHARKYDPYNGRERCSRRPRSVDPNKPDSNRGDR